VTDRKKNTGRTRPDSPRPDPPLPGAIPKVRVIDKRFWARPDAELPDGEGAVDLDLKPSYVRELEQKMALMEQKFREKTAWFEEETQRIQERLGREMGRRLEEEKGRIALDLLEVLDNLETAVEAFRQQATMDQLRQGVELVRDGFQRKMERLGLQPVGQAGEPFDPRIHEAIDVQAVAQPEQEGRVLAVWQRGYASPDRLVRPARVSVGRFAEPLPQAAEAARSTGPEAPSDLS
jgi:molecular chaperone GrpE (heat shock protein)